MIGASPATSRKARSRPIAAAAATLSWSDRGMAARTSLGEGIHEADLLGFGGIILDVFEPS
ncbi:hypothetical protein FHU38_003695 [Saccharomonospora amisosensis]|uniref:Uncharacterized protein n=1 Tax=Saccharomonospora amisosensis TaxID=1128677 RepID=A0A7X5USE2_9PSEU|nr:hypothetical protein [Saccharomonospora amisosensis]NIJ13351.1 hypothetical protein [Saccharomonospora amisosensis]